MNRHNAASEQWKWFHTLPVDISKKTRILYLLLQDCVLKRASESDHIVVLFLWEDYILKFVSMKTACLAEANFHWLVLASIRVYKALKAFGAFSNISIFSDGQLACFNDALVAIRHWFSTQLFLIRWDWCQQNVEQDEKLGTLFCYILK